MDQPGHPINRAGKAARRSALMPTSGSVRVSSAADDALIFDVTGAVVVGAVSVPVIWRIAPTNATTALPLVVVVDLSGRAVLTHGGTVGDGRGRPGSGRDEAGGGRARLPELPGFAAPVGMGPRA